MNLQFLLRVRNRRDVLPRVVMLLHRRGLDVLAVEFVSDDSADMATMRVSLRSAETPWDRIAAHLRNLADVSVVWNGAQSEM